MTVKGQKLNVVDKLTYEEETISPEQRILMTDDEATARSANVVMAFRIQRKNARGALE